MDAEQLLGPVAGLSLADAAQHYAGLGVPVFPCVPGEKRPLVAHGFKDATADTAQVGAWWRRWPEANMSSVAFGRGFFYRVFRRTGCGFAAQYAASCSAGGTWPSSPWRRRSLYQSTHSAVANSTSLMPTHGPRLRMSSAL